MEDINNIDANMQLKSNNCIHSPHLYIHILTPNTDSIKHMVNYPTNPLVMNTNTITRMRRAHIQGRLSMLTTRWIHIMGSYRTMKFWVLLKNTNVQANSRDNLASFG